MYFSSESESETDDESEDESSSYGSVCSEDTVRMKSDSDDDDVTINSSTTEPEDLREDPELPHGSATEAKEVDVSTKVSRISFLVLSCSFVIGQQFITNAHPTYLHFSPELHDSYGRTTVGSISKTFYETILCFFLILLNELLIGNEGNNSKLLFTILILFELSNANSTRLFCLSSNNPYSAQV